MCAALPACWLLPINRIHRSSAFPGGQGRAIIKNTGRLCGDRPAFQSSLSPLHPSLSFTRDPGLTRYRCCVQGKCVKETVLGRSEVKHFEFFFTRAINKVTRGWCVGKWWTVAKDTTVKSGLRRSVFLKLILDVYSEGLELIHRPKRNRWYRNRNKKMSGFPGGLVDCGSHLEPIRVVDI